MPVNSFNTRTGDVTLESADVTTALTFTPEDAAHKKTTGPLGTSTVDFPVEEVVKTYVDGIAATIPQADNEDLYEQGTTLKFADRAFDAAAFSGYGFKILRKNIVGGVNLLTQSMMNTANTVYEIRYDYNLNGATIIIPAGCILAFKGGSIKNGTLTGNYTKIISGLYNILYSTNCDGSWNVEAIYPEWFGAKGDLVNDDTVAVQRAFEFNGQKGKILISGRHLITAPLFMYSDNRMYGNAYECGFLSTITTGHYMLYVNATEDGNYRTTPHSIVEIKGLQFRYAVWIYVSSPPANIGTKCIYSWAHNIIENCDFSYFDNSYTRDKYVDFTVIRNCKIKFNNITDRDNTHYDLVVSNNSDNFLLENLSGFNIYVGKITNGIINNTIQYGIFAYYSRLLISGLHNENPNYYKIRLSGDSNLLLTNGFAHRITDGSYLIEVMQAYAAPSIIIKSFVFGAHSEPVNQNLALIRPEIKISQNTRLICEDITRLGRNSISAISLINWLGLTMDYKDLSARFSYHCGKILLASFVSDTRNYFYGSATMVSTPYGSPGFTVGDIFKYTLHTVLDYQRKLRMPVHSVTYTLTVTDADKEISIPVFLPSSGAGSINNLITRTNQTTGEVKTCVVQTINTNNIFYDRNQDICGQALWGAVENYNEAPLPATGSLLYKNDGYNVICALSALPVYGTWIDGDVVIVSNLYYDYRSGVWIKRSVQPATASANTASDAGTTYSQTEVQAILDELRDLKTKMRTAGLLNT